MAKQLDLATLKVAIVHDWLVGGGAEKVVLELHRMFPNAPIYTSYATDEWRQKLDNKVITGWLQYLGKFRKFLPYFREKWFRGLDLTDFDLVISSSGNGEARAVTVQASGKHINYCHAVNQFYWTEYDQYMQNPGQRPYWLMRLGLKILVKSMRRKDYQSAQKPDVIIANSTAVQQDIQDFYHRDSKVISPPVETSYARPIVARSGFVTMGRLVSWKRIDLIIEACNKLQLDLTIIGDGPDKQRLQKLAGPTVRFTGWLEGDERLDIIAASQAFIMANSEPFGIAPVEAMATGTPVIAYRSGGALDYVIPGKTGEFFDSQNPASLAVTIERFVSSPKYSADDIKTNAQRFSIDEFQKSMLSEVIKVIQ